jgi:hypothetical protein
MAMPKKPQIEGNKWGKIWEGWYNRFVDECLILDDQSSCRSVDLWTAFRRWGDLNGVKKTFCKIEFQRFLAWDRKIKRIEIKQRRFYRCRIREGI